MAIMETVLEIPAEHERNIFGNFDSNIKKIEKNKLISYNILDFDKEKERKK